MKRLPLILFLFAPVLAVCQKLDYSVQAGVNYPIVGDVSRAPISVVQIPSTSGFFSLSANVGRITESFVEQPGIFLAGRVTRRIQKVFLSAGLSIEYRRFNRSINVEKPEEIEFALINPGTVQTFGPIIGGFIVRDANGNVVIDPDGQPVTPEFNSADKIGDTEVFSLEMPILIGTHFMREKFLLQFGISPGYVVQAKEYRGFFQMEGYSFLNPGTLSWEVQKKKSSSDFNRFTFGLNLSTTYRITSKIGVQLSAMRNLSPIYRSSAEGAGSAYLNSVSLGINYFLTKNQF